MSCSIYARGPLEEYKCILVSCLAFDGSAFRIGSMSFQLNQIGAKMIVLAFVTSLIHLLPCNSAFGAIVLVALLILYPLYVLYI